MRRGRVWWIQYREGGQRVRESLQTENRKLAEELRLRRQIEVGQRQLGMVPPAVVVAAVPANGGGGAVAPPVVAAGPIVVPPAGEAAVPETSLEQVRADYAAWSVAHKRPKTILNDKARLAEFFAFVPGKALREIRTADVERFLTHKATSGKRPATQMRHREILHAFWRWAQRQGHVETNVVTPIPRLRIPERDPVFLSLDEVDELMAGVAGTNVEAAIGVAVFAGLRREELCWLTWDDVEFDRSPVILRVRAKTIDGESWQTKTKRDRRVPVSPRLLEVLLRHRDQRRNKRVPWLLPSPQGCRWDPDNLSTDIRAAFRAAKLQWNLLQLRHTFGSQLARKGVSLLKIAKLMGNSPAIASRHYINLVPEDMGDDVAF